MSEMADTVENATRTFCGCIGDDIDLSVEEHRTTQAKEDLPYALIDGKESSTAEAVEATAQILVEARFPVIYGLSNTTCEAQRVAVGIADTIGGNIDTTSSVYQGPSGIAFQSVGQPLATLGEIKNRADLVIYWGGDPAELHPRLFTRHSVTSKGMFVPNGRQDRTVVLVDMRGTHSASAADIFIQPKPDTDFELLWTLRALVKGLPIDPSIEQTTGVPLAMLRDLAGRMKNCRYGVLFGMGLATTRGNHFNSGALLALATDLNQYTHFVAMLIRGPGNAAGADNVLSWQTGFPFAVNFGRGFPRFNPGEFTTVDMLARGEADAAMIIASDPAADFPGIATEHLDEIPTIVLDAKSTVTRSHAKVAFTTAAYGINTRGTVYRMDGVALPLRPGQPSPYPSDEEVLESIKARVHELLTEKQGAPMRL
jgi:formylmethanofuran dehydrogenase subunit B